MRKNFLITYRLDPTHSSWIYFGRWFSGKQKLVDIKKQIVSYNDFFWFWPFFDLMAPSDNFRTDCRCQTNCRFQNSAFSCLLPRKASWKEMLGNLFLKTVSNLAYNFCGYVLQAEYCLLVRCLILGTQSKFFCYTCTYLHIYVVEFFYSIGWCTLINPFLIDSSFH